MPHKVHDRVIERYPSITAALDAYRDVFRSGLDRSRASAFARLWVECEIGVALARPGAEKRRARLALAYVVEQFNEALSENLKPASPASAPSRGSGVCWDCQVGGPAAGPCSKCAPAPSPAASREVEEVREALCDSLATLPMLLCRCGNDFRCSRCKAMDSAGRALRALSPVESPGEDDWSHRCPECGASVCSHVVLMARRAAAPREVEEVRDAIRAALDGGCFKHPQIPQRLRAALSRLSSSPETTTENDNG